MNDFEVGIVGAVPSGLSLARQLKTAGISFQIHEKHTAVGGLWDIDNPVILDLAHACFVTPDKKETGIKGLSVDLIVRAALLNKMMGLIPV